MINKLIMIIVKVYCVESVSQVSVLDCSQMSARGSQTLYHSFGCSPFTVSHYRKYYDRGHCMTQCSAVNH